MQEQPQEQQPQEELLVNEYFNDFPIDYFKINPEDFIPTIGMPTSEEANHILDASLNNIQSTTITPDDEGRIYDQLIQNIDLTTKDTTVINAGVGQGKTYSILRITKDYFENHSDTYIVIAVPYVSLVEQYTKELIEIGIPENDIYKYDWLNPSHQHSTLEEQLRRRIHIVTANCLLGNAGENAIINSKIKRQYLKYFPQKLEGKEYFLGEENVEMRDLEILNVTEFLQLRNIISERSNPENRKKVVFIYDEIHDAIPNFTAENLYYLLGWSNVIHKNFVISATYNDASLVIMKYLSNLTNQKIKIIDSEKIRNREKQSELFLHFNNSLYYDKNDKIITKVVSDSIDRGKEIDILSYSKTLLGDIYKEGSSIGTALKGKYGENINLCISELQTNQRTVANTNDIKRFDANMCNIGTNFKTGISIEKDNHSFIIIMPPKGSKKPFGNQSGIFSGGINDIIQALARQRIKGEIHIILPSPRKMKYETLPEMNDEQKEKFISAYNNIHDNSYSESEREISQEVQQSRGYNELSKKSHYHYLNEQSRFIKDGYDVFIDSIYSPLIKHFDDIRYNDILGFPSLDKFRVDKGQKAIIKIPFFGEDLSTYISYGAFTNQFLNCRLAGIYHSRVFFTSADFESELENYFEQYSSDLVNQPSIEDLFKKSEELLFTDNEIFLNGIKVRKKNYTSKMALLKMSLKIKVPEYFEDNSLYKRAFGDSFNSTNYVMHHLKDIIENRVGNGRQRFSDVKEGLFTLRQRLKDSLIPNRENKYLKANLADNNSLFDGINTSEILNQMKIAFPLLMTFQNFKNVLKEEATENSQKEFLFKLLSKSLGSLEKSNNRHSFSELSLRKITGEIY